jgi:hypothetical protein
VIYARDQLQPSLPESLRARVEERGLPLREGEADVALDLQALIDLCYANGRYENDLDYRSEPSPPLDAPDAAWADALLREKGLRP